MEVLKVLGGFGDALSQRMQTLDAADSSFYTVKLKQRNSACAVCSGSYRSINTMLDSKQWSIQNGLEVSTLALPEGLPSIRCSFILYINIQLSKCVRCNMRGIASYSSKHFRQISCGSLCILCSAQY
jgi:hypothetical protein